MAMTVSLGQALLWYTLIVLGVLAFILFLGSVRPFRRRKERHLILQCCESCGLVFAVSRFHNRFKEVRCPRCGKEQFPRYSLNGKHPDEG